ncbi:hypothetical protein BJD12_19330 [Xanthomonas vesicatoria ATCC 35937]|uniref:Uncharacterized protein n=1 Tax=Xanthomonas vesicatoria ATCC 35937 TaxID=925775 RepID=F0BGB8_9XANT|nr:hypothetical protein [Xanthomonas vesicatoria]APP77016.1 hypothetical protein BJD12_19330 [Xanthomonas vesicatoria ATCC 35937]EGD08490.1 hypothetical protein XVE_3292 [Xanthomonas vesicatoria ATCC 35937]KTF32489.1 hypothetical protein LMG920_12880 [Xanthomonas vesicatoria]MCC8597107.1 hypothetical protein [Xanthomonas vesicatoria]MCC8605814.1 hypothetical protein [Xanthomonas vesicatoria]
MRTFVRPAFLGLALIFSPAWSAAPRPTAAVPAHAPVSGAASPTDAASSELLVPLPATLKQGMNYRAFSQAIAEQGWQPVDPLAADSCMAAGDCEIEFVAPRAGARLRVQVGSHSGAAVVQNWTAKRAPADRMGATSASIDAPKDAPAAISGAVAEQPR